MGELDDIARRARAEGKKEFDRLSTSEQVGKLLSQRSRTEGTIQDADRRATYFGNARSGDFDAEARNGNRAVADRARRELREIDTQLAKRGVADVEQEKRDYISKTGRHRAH